MVVSLRTMRASDIPAGLRLCRAARWNQLRQDWEWFLATSPGGCRVAVTETDEVIGSVATIRYGNTFGWIAMVLVDPEYRRAGIGRQLLQEALDILADMPAIGLDATPAGQRIYIPCGFREEYRLQRMQRNAGPVGLASDALVRSMAEGDLENVIEQDRNVFGVDRRTLLERLRSDAPEYAWVTGRGQIEAYVFGRHGYAFEHIGPLIARDEAARRALVCACLSACPGRPFVIDVPVRDAWIGWLESIAFTLQRPFIRMCRGEQEVRARPDQMFAIAGPEFG